MTGEPRIVKDAVANHSPLQLSLRVKGLQLHFVERAVLHIGVGCSIDICLAHRIVAGPVRIGVGIPPTAKISQRRVTLISAPANLDIQSA
jgi:hypothetical protein